jgi:hypothetical protein
MLPFWEGDSRCSLALRARRVGRQDFGFGMMFRVSAAGLSQQWTVFVRLAQALAICRFVDSLREAESLFTTKWSTERLLELLWNSGSGSCKKNGSARPQCTKERSSRRPSAVGTNSEGTTIRERAKCMGVPNSADTETRYPERRHRSSLPVRSSSFCAGQYLEVGQ